MGASLLKMQAGVVNTTEGKMGDAVLQTMFFSNDIPHRIQQTTASLQIIHQHVQNVL